MLRTPVYAFDRYNESLCKMNWKGEVLGELREAFNESLSVSTHDLLPALSTGKEPSLDAKRATLKP